MDKTEQQKIMTRLQQLLNLSLERGAFPGEVEVAAYKIGSMVQKYGLVVSFPQSESADQFRADFQESMRRAAQQERERRERAEQARREREWGWPKPSFAHIEVLIIGETEKALLCRSQEDESEFWIPRSQCREGCERWTRGDSGLLYVSRWWAEKEGWV